MSCSRFIFVFITSTNFAQDQFVLSVVHVQMCQVIKLIYFLKPRWTKLPVCFSGKTCNLKVAHWPNNEIESFIAKVSIHFENGHHIFPLVSGRSMYGMSHIHGRSEKASQVKISNGSKSNGVDGYLTFIVFVSFESQCEKTGLWGFRPGLTQTGLCSYRRWLEA